jgi:PAS domain S-box-containing protein
VVSNFAVDFFFTPPLYVISINLGHISRLTTYIFAAVFFAKVSDARRRADRILKQGRDALEREVQQRTAELTRANERLAAHAALLDLSHDTIFVRDINNVITYWNRGAEERYGWSREEAVGQVSHTLMRTDFPSLLEHINAELVDTGRWEGELHHWTRDGRELIVASRWSLQRDANGTPVAILETNNDISERKRAEQALRDNERRYRHIFEGTGVSIWEQDFSHVKAAIDALRRSGVRDFRAYLKANPHFVDEAISLVRVVDVNDATVKMFAAGSKDELIRSLHAVFTNETREAFAGELLAISEHRASYEGETSLKKLNGEPMVALFSVSFPRRDAAFDTVLVSIMDITSRKRAEQELEELAGRLINAQEQERSRIGRELHDHISQMLGVQTIRIDQLRADANPPELAGALDELRQRMQEITSDIHGLSHRLHSSTLDYLGLVPALQRLVNDFGTRHNIEITFTHQGLPTPLPSDIALCLFRVVEESLNNIAKHSGATSASIDIAGDTRGIALTVEDSGAGFDPAALQRRAGLGFVSMRERLRVVRGMLHVDSAPGRGTAIHISVPVAHRVSASFTNELRAPARN